MNYLSIWKTNARVRPFREACIYIHMYSDTGVTYGLHMVLNVVLHEFECEFVYEYERWDLYEYECRDFYANECGHVYDYDCGPVYDYECGHVCD